jgi:starch-binding outer membrane protein, SusD/RagB family
MSNSCTKDFLNKEPLGVPSSQILYNSPAGATMLINAVYAFTRDNTQLQYPWFATQVCASDDADPGSTTVDGGATRIKPMHEYTYFSTQADVLNFWGGAYLLIARANLVINEVPAITFTDEALKARMIGEAKFFRAKAYFNLVRGYGGVPIVTKVPKTPEEAAIVEPRSTVADVYALITQDLTDAIAVLPLKNAYAASEKGRVTKGTAQTLLAQVYLHQGNYTSCLSECLNVINSLQYSLCPVYGDNWNSTKENGVESIFEVQYIARTEQDLTNNWVQYQGVRGYTGWGYVSPSAELANSWDVTDPRRDRTIFFKGEFWPGTTSGTVTWEAGTSPRANEKSMLPKPWAAGVTESNQPVNKVEMRYADVLLMAAECYNEANDPTNALLYLEMIRSRARAGLAVLPKVTETNKTLLRHIIWNERRWELAMEGYRMMDIRRYDKLEPGFAKALFTSNGKTAYTVGKHELFPIPQVEIDFASGVLTQNPGW